LIAVKVSVLHRVWNGGPDEENAMNRSARGAESNEHEAPVVRGRRTLVAAASTVVLGGLYRAIVHVTDGEPDKWTRVIGYVRGLESTAERADLAVAVVVQGLALDMLKADSPVAKAVGEAMGRGVEVVACEYSMKVRNLTRAQLTPSVVSFVPFGGIEIIRRQNAGWAYLRP